MSEEQLARYWSLLDENGNPLTGEIRAMSERPVEEGRLIYAVMGGHRRYYRPIADDWAWDEADSLRKACTPADSSEDALDDDAVCN